MMLLLTVGPASACKSRSAAPDPWQNAASEAGAARAISVSRRAVAFPGSPVRPLRSRFCPCGSRGPVILALHGFGGDAAGLVGYFQLKAVADAHGVLVVAPPGSRNPDGSSYWNAGGACCDLYDEHPDDIAYLDAVLDDLTAHYKVDPDRLFVVGHSNGAFMAYWYACQRAERVAAIVSLAGEALADPSACHPQEPVAVLQVQGDADEIVPYAGGNLGSPGVARRLAAAPIPPAPRGHPRALVRGRAQSADLGAALDGCGPLVDQGQRLDIDVRIAGEETSVARATGCKGGAAELWSMHGGTHVPSLSSGWGERMYRFLQAHPKR